MAYVSIKSTPISQLLQTKLIEEWVMGNGW